MKFLGVSLLSCCLAISGWAQNLADQVGQMEAAGNSSGARTLLEQTIRDEPGDIDSLTTFAEFLDRHGDPQARDVYGRLLDRTADDQNKIRIARRLVDLDLIAGDRDAATRHLKAYRDAGGAGLAGTVPPVAEHSNIDFAEVPGPIESFARMAALSTAVEPADILPALARNVINSGYRVSSSYEGLRPTEYMKLINRYLSQARELEQVAGGDQVIRIEQCDSTDTADLLRVLGYRMRGGCGSEVILETVNASRAFLTIDSGFPLANLEQSLRTNRPFVYDFHPMRLPVLYGRDYWMTSKDRENHEPFIDVLLGDPSLCRLYIAMSKLDRPTADALRARASREELKAFAHVLDFFGGLFLIENGHAVVPGGPAAQKVWAKLVGVSPDKGAEFYERLVAADDGWLASYYDSLRRLQEGPVKAYLTEPARLERFYAAIRGRVTSPGPARPVFRSNGDLMLLTTGMWTEKDGTPHLPGNLDVWKRLFVDSPDNVYDGNLKRSAMGWKNEDDVLEALFALCRKPVENQPLKIYMALSSVDRGRSQPLDPATVNLMARAWPEFGAQYQLFAETPLVSAGTIQSYLTVAKQIDDTGNRMLRADRAGSFEALTGLWQIFVRNGAIPDDKIDSTLADIISGFTNVSNDRELFDRQRHSIELLAQVTGGPGDQPLQDYFLNLLTGSAHPQDIETQRQMVSEMRRIFDAQKLVALDDILDVADHLEALANGGDLDTTVVNRLSSRLEEIRSRREALSGAEKSTLSFGHWSQQHIEDQQDLRLRNEIRQAIGSPDHLRELRGELAGILRDTLVGYNYLHYAPPGAQLLRTNPLFVRSHSFIGPSGKGAAWQEPKAYATGWPSSGGGRLVGSLSGLAYALADAEQDFLVPSTEQALIWTDLVPQMMVTAKVPRWWNVSPELMHWTALHTRVAQSAVAESVVDPGRRELVLSTLSRHASPGRIDEVIQQIEAGDVAEALDNITPAELFLIGAAVTEGPTTGDPLSAEIRRLAAADPSNINDEAVSLAFGSPKPTLLSSYQPRLLNLRTFPTLMGYSSRIMAESWESNLIYYAALADSLYLRPSQLNVKVPEWTRSTVEKIFATHLEDWPAVLRSLRRVGEDVRLAAQPAAEDAASMAAIQR